MCIEECHRESFYYCVPVGTVVYDLAVGPGAIYYQVLGYFSSVRYGFMSWNVP